MQFRLAPREGLEGNSPQRGRRVTPAAAVSILAHLVLVVALWKTVLVPAGMNLWFQPRSSESVEAKERVQFVTVTPQAPAPAVSLRSGRAGAPRVAPAPPIVAPREIPTGIPAPGATTAPAPAAPTGPLTGGSGPTRGVQPTYVDPRVWVQDPPLVYAPKTAEERLDSALATTLKRAEDSLAAVTHTPNKFERGDWTVERNGKKYGIDKNYIHLGKFSIPTALLALLPLNSGQGNPIDLERQRNLSAMSADIQYHARATITEAEFRAAVKAIRERKEREHQGLQQRIAATPRDDPRTLVSPGDKPPR